MKKISLDPIKYETRVARHRSKVTVNVTLLSDRIPRAGGYKEMSSILADQ
jgi:hypothetical protein